MLLPNGIYQVSDLERELALATEIYETHPDSARNIALSVINYAKTETRPKLEMEANFLLAKIAISNGSEKEAFYYLKITEDIAFGIENTQTVVDALCEKALVYKNLVRTPDSALALFKKAQNISKVIQYPHGDIISGMGISHLKMDEGNYLPAVDILLSLKSKYKNKSTHYDYSSLLNNIGHAYMKIGMYPEATEQFKEASTLVEKNGQKSRLTFLSQINLAEIYYKSDSIEKAFTIIDNIKSQLKTSKNPFIEGAASQMLGDIYLAKKEYNKALETFENAIKAKYTNNFTLSYRLTIGKAKALWGLKKYSEAHKITIEEIELAKKYENSIPLINLMEGYKLLSASYNYFNDLENALKYSNLYQKSYATIYNNKSRSDIFRNEVNNRMLLQKEQDRLENDLLKEQIKTEEREVLILIIIALFLLASIVVFIIRFIQKNKLNYLLEIKNEELNKSKKEIETKNKELEIKNKEIENQNEQLEFTNDMIVSINESLEKLIHSRAKEITHKDEILQEYAFINAHKLRAPVARILGLCKLINHSEDIDEKEDLVRKILYEVRDLDRIVLTITNTILKGGNPERKDLDK